jgi:lipoyl(octanoyl) transferase
VLLDLTRRARDVRGFVSALESWVIATLGDFGVESWRSDAGVGIWTRDIDGTEAKIGAIGVRIRKWVTMHGFRSICRPTCRIFRHRALRYRGKGVTSLERLGIHVPAKVWDEALLARSAQFLALLDQPCPKP